MTDEQQGPPDISPEHAERILNRPPPSEIHTLGEPFAYTPDDVAEKGVEDFKRLWPEKWDAWVAWCESEDKPKTITTVGEWRELQAYDDLAQAYEELAKDPEYTRRRPERSVQTYKPWATTSR